MIARRAYDMNGCKFDCHDWKVYMDLKRYDNKGRKVSDFYVAFYSNGAMVWPASLPPAFFITAEELGFVGARVGVKGTDIPYTGATALRAVRVLLARKKETG